MLDLKTHTQPSLRCSKNRLIKTPMGFQRSLAEGGERFHKDPFLCVCVCIYSAFAHGEAMSKLVIHKINLGLKPLRRLSVPVLMISSVLHSPNILNAHHPENNHIFGSCSPLEKIWKRLKGEEKVLFISLERQRSRFV